MSVIPAFELGIWNAWLFMIVFLLQWLIVALFPGRIAKRTSHPSDVKPDRNGKITGLITQVFWMGAILYSVFLPFKTATAWFYAGLGFFITGLIILILATVSVSRTEMDKPFTGGIYRFSRHPMYLSMILIYIGVSVACTSWLFLVITVVTFFLQRWQMIQEEKYCLAKFGQDYREYMHRTARWIGIPKNS
ncbi:MAG: isoprenylcysteine carboxylmethyltransferase family protein [Dehalococcoidales bacterium]|nr:isoprenylcysteine carboxylmethyltransferase family protein [Dehalococcoidales bacterium]